MNTANEQKLQKDKAYLRPLGWLLASSSSLLLILLLLLLSIDLVTYDINFYRRQFAELDRPRVIGISEQELLRVTEELMAYMSGRRPELDSRAVIKGEERYVFNERERSHMVDVQNLYTLSRNAQTLSLICIVLFSFVLWLLFKKRMLRYLAKAYLIVLAVVTALLIALGSAIALNFSAFWIQFHMIFFTNDLWILDPRTDILIQMVPEQFFLNTAWTILTYLVVGITVFGILSVLALKSRRLLL